LSKNILADKNFLNSPKFGTNPTPTVGVAAINNAVDSDASNAGGSQIISP
jgi:hypothetical protein